MTALKQGVFVVGCKRTPFGTLGGRLREHSPVLLQTGALKAALEAGGVAPHRVQGVVVGCVMQWASKDGRAVARAASLRAGVPLEAPALVVNRACGSGFQSVINAAQDICMGDAEVVLAGGCDTMSLAPFTARGLRYGTKLGQSYVLEDTLWSGLTDWNIQVSMGMTAENLADKYNITREQCDLYALRSQHRWKAARDAGLFSSELCPVSLMGRGGAEELMTEDEHPKPETDMAKLSRLHPVFKKGGVVTAGNASGISDGAGAMLVMGEGALGDAQPLARVAAYAVVGCDPHIMGIGPVPAIRRLLQAAQLPLERVDLVEVNEAFAAQYLAVVKELGLDPDRTNVCGGAIALGHPLGATGARILSHLAHQLNRLGVRYGVGSACIGGGQGIAVLLENVNHST